MALLASTGASNQGKVTSISSAALAMLLLPSPAVVTAQVPITGIDVANMDPTVSPREDFSPLRHWRLA